MAVRPLVVAPDERLKEISKPVEEITDEIRTLIKDMLDTMYENHGIGLAAIQVGVPLRIIVMDLSQQLERYPEMDTHGKGSVCVINPEIIESSEEQKTFEEGCLSFPGQFANVKRPAKVKLKYMDENGQEHIDDGDGIFAVCVQHEMDHLEGIVFTDHISKLKRNLILSRMAKIRKKIDHA